MNALHADVMSIKRTLDSQDRVFAERSKLDDARADKLDCRLDDIEERVDKHGLRTTVVEMQFASFFGEQGAFRMVIKKLEDNGEKLDLLNGKFLTVAISIAGGALALIGAVGVWMVEHHS